MENDKPDTTVLLAQYEQSWKQVEHFDTTYTQMALLYMALLSAYIANFDKFKVYATLVSVCIALIGVCIIGAIWRLRKLVDQQLSIISEIEQMTSMKSRHRIKGLGTVRTSTYLVIIILALSGFAILLTLTQP